MTKRLSGRGAIDMSEYHKVQALAKRFNLAPNTIRKLFADDPAVLRVSLGTGQRTALLIPELSVARVQERLSNNALKSALPRHRPLRVVRLRDLDAGVAKKPRNVLKRNAAKQCAHGEGVS